jgi:hypothetical protein
MWSRRAESAAISARWSRTTATGVAQTVATNQARWSTLMGVRSYVKLWCSRDVNSHRAEAATTRPSWRSTPAARPGNATNRASRVRETARRSDDDAIARA